MSHEYVSVAPTKESPIAARSDRQSVHRSPEPSTKAPAALEALAPSSAASETVRSWSSLQRTVGNRQAIAILGAQSRLEVGAANDPLEQEADIVSEHVIKRLQKKGADPRVRSGTAETKSQSLARMIRRRTVPRVVGSEGGLV